MVGGLVHPATANQIQTGRVGRVAEQAKNLAASRRRALPRHPLAQPRCVRASVWRRDFKRDVHEPLAFRSKGQFFGLKHPGGTIEQAIAVRCFRACSCADHGCADRPCGGGKEKFHDDFRGPASSKKDLSLPGKIACGSEQIKRQSASCSFYGPDPLSQIRDSYLRVSVHSRTPSTRRVHESDQRVASLMSPNPSLTFVSLRSSCGLGIRFRACGYRGSRMSNPLH